MKILALEFSSERRSAAVWTEAGLGGRAEESGGRPVAAFPLTLTLSRRFSFYFGYFGELDKAM